MKLATQLTEGSLYLWWSRMAAMTGKELLQLGRDTLLVGAVLYLFTLCLLYTSPSPRD